MTKFKSDKRRKLSQEMAKLVNSKKFLQFSPLYNMKIRALSPRILPLHPPKSSISFRRVAGQDYLISLAERYITSKIRFLCLRFVFLSVSIFGVGQTLSPLLPGANQANASYSSNPPATMLIFLFFDLWCLVLSFIYFSKNFPAFINRIEADWHQIGLANTTIAKNYIEKRLKTLKTIIRIVFSAWLLESFISLLNTVSDRRGSLNHFIFLSSLAITLINSVAFISTVYQLGVACIFIGSSYHCLKVMLERDVSTSCVNLQMLRRYRSMHSQTTDLTLKMNDFWKIYLFFFYLFLLPMMVVILYNLFYVRFNLIGYVSLFLTFIMHVPTFVCLTLSVTRVNSLASSPYDEIYLVTLERTGDDFKIEAQFFLDRIARSDTGFTFWDMFIITPNIASTIMTAISTLLVAIPSF
ncbi:uncharacterized protein LOC141851873 [Brevipalpus obovatus]|uniref:uncharacterized protein LOC141851873 n=1 Tax=Brevipalpus obovatus TaxID=246614 RepID=UPI003D9F83CE